MNLWTTEAAEIAGVLDGQARLVGGCVRDWLRHAEVTDIDMATPLLPDMVEQRLQAASIRTITIGKKFGTIGAVLNGKKYDITTLRRDIKTDGRHAEVTFTRSYVVDSRRRDFTINALYMDIAGQVYDFHNGISDLNAGIVRFIGSPEQRIKEDYLRILRYFRFWALVSKTGWDEAVLAACIKHRAGLQKVSAERQQEELRKLKAAPRADEALAKMCELNLLPRGLNCARMTQEGTE